MYGHREGEVLLVCCVSPNIYAHIPTSQTWMRCGALQGKHVMTNGLIIHFNHVIPGIVMKQLFEPCDGCLWVINGWRLHTSTILSDHVAFSSSRSAACFLLTFVCSLSLFSERNTFSWPASDVSRWG